MNNNKNISFIRATHKAKVNLRAARLIIPVIFLGITQNVYADEPLCKTQPDSILKKNTFSSDGKTHLQADSVELSEKDISRFKGNVVIQQPNKRIETEEAQYKKQFEKVEAQGNIRLITPGIQINSDSANFDLKTDHAILKNAEYQSLTSRARGEASQIEIKNKNITELSDATYTTCEADKTDWLLSANSITLNNKSRQGSAKHVVLRFKNVPFFYFPYLRFPLGEERLSGFLFPSFGSSDKHGSEFKIPYYWNIHPQLDATITPWYMSKRGTLLDTELRYLTENNKGTLRSEYLNNDKLVNDKRERFYWLHQSTPGLGWQANAEYNYIADKDHLTDFSNNLNNTSTTYLVRKGNIAYNSTNWVVNINAEGYQIISGTEPYQRLPQITVNSRYSETDNTFNYTIQSEAVRFDHNDSSKTVGDRLHLKPGVAYPLRSAAGFLVPKLSVDLTRYNLEQATGTAQISRSIPTFSLNGGLFFERDSQIFNNNYIQTLEPQLFYVYVPYKDQSAIPVFDTSVYAYNVNQSFTDYRFSGIDRIGDDNRLTVALATRFINQQSGQEVFMARAGQIYYFSDRKVQLPGTAVDKTSRSNIIAELKILPANWNLSSQLEWDPRLNEKVTSSTQLGFRYNKFNLNLAHRFQRSTLETRELKMNWDLSSRWQFNVAHLYDLKNEHIVENLLGIKYESCCWGLRLSTKERYLSNTQTDRGIYLELVLKGLGGFGTQQ